MKDYKVLAQCVVHIPMNTSAGSTLGTLYKGATFSGDEASEKIKFLVEAEMIGEIGKDGQPVKAKDDKANDKPADAEGDDEPKVNARSSRAELLAYATKHGGMTDDDANKLSNKQLIDRFVKAAPAE
jgi:hypothetical protein